MRNRFLQVFVVIASFAAILSVARYSTNYSAEDNDMVNMVSENSISIDDITPLENSVSNNMIIFQSENVTVSIDTGSAGTDDISQKIVSKWEWVSSVDQLCDIIHAIYNKYNCGLSCSVDYYEDGDTSITVYELTDGVQVEYIRYADHSIALRDKETSSIFWTSKEYDSN